MEASEAIVKLKQERAIKTEPCVSNPEQAAIFDGNIKLEVKTEPDIVEFDTSIFTQHQPFQANDFEVSSKYISYDSEVNDIDGAIVDDAIVKEEPEFYDSCVGEIVPSTQLTQLLESSTTSLKCSDEKSNSVQKLAKIPSKPFKCEQCSASFSQNFMLKQHTKIHKQMSKVEPPVGSYRVRQFSNRQRIISHERVPKCQKPFECLICRKKFSSKVAFDSHQTIHTGEKLFQCDHCSRQFRLKHHLESHSKIHTKKVQATLLTDDSKLFAANEVRNVSETKQDDIDESNIDKLEIFDDIVKEEPEFYDPCVGEVVPSIQLTQSLESNAIAAIKCGENSKSAKKCTPSKPFKCRHCSATFDQSAMLKQHTKIHQQMANAQPFVCSYCCRQFSNRQRLTSHERVHKGEQPFECLICHKRFNTKVSLDTHQTIHNGKKPFQCDQCDQRFRLKQHMHIHRKIHTKNLKFAKNNRTLVEPIPEHVIGLKLFECYLCSERFQFNRSYLKLHFQSMHIGSKVYECDHCSKKFLLKYSIIKHIQRVHMRTNPHQCHVCSKQFFTKDDLQHHSRNYHNTKGQKFQCDFCPMQLSTKSILKIHRKTHTNMKPYECEYCEKKFLKPGCLRRHTMTHTGERPFGCNICFQKFSRNHLLTDHKRNVHKMFRM